MVLDQIFPKSPERDALELEAARHCQALPRKMHTGLSMHGMSTNKKQGRFLQFRSKLLDKFSTLKNAFDSFCHESAADSGEYKKELSLKDFMRFLSRHFPGMSHEDQERTFEF